MSNIAIRVEGLGKMYRIGGKQERYRTLRDTLTDAFAAPFRRASSLLRGQAYGAADLKETIWALKDVSFEVKHGEVVGIIGRNGAGKSTLLKILSRITEPTEGYADVYGRVGSLLEVGTGFHPELTGRENIYLNGAILGMSRAEIDRKFDEIVAFAEIEKFVDTPVKHYSSGMALRLGFAVAAHLEPEILVVDEVLAVGDAQFQKKCLGKMSEVAGEGRTVLFVSHNMAAILELCDLAILLQDGRIRTIGPTSETISKYLEEGLIRKRDLSARETERVFIQQIRLLNNETLTTTMPSNTALAFEVDCEADPSVLPRLCLGFVITDSLGHRIMGSNMEQYGNTVVNRTGQYTFRIYLDRLPLRPGVYSISLYLGDGRRDLDVVVDAAHFDVLWDCNLGIRPPKSSWGPLFVPVRFETTELGNNGGDSS